MLKVAVLLCIVAISVNSRNVRLRRSATVPQDFTAEEAANILKNAQPGTDFPVWDVIPETSYQCAGHTAGIRYADVETGCQIFRLCDELGNLNSYICPNFTIFNDETQTCQWFFQVNCKQTAGVLPPPPPTEPVQCPAGCQPSVPPPTPQRPVLVIKKTKVITPVQPIAPPTTVDGGYGVDMTEHQPEPEPIRQAPQPVPTQTVDTGYGSEVPTETAQPGYGGSIEEVNKAPAPAPLPTNPRQTSYAAPQPEPINQAPQQPALPTNVRQTNSYGPQQDNTVAQRAQQTQQTSQDFVNPFNDQVVPSMRTENFNNNKNGGQTGFSNPFDDQSVSARQMPQTNNAGRTVKKTETKTFRGGNSMNQQDFQARQAVPSQSTNGQTVPVMFAQLPTSAFTQQGRSFFGQQSNSPMLGVPVNMQTANLLKSINGFFPGAVA